MDRFQPALNSIYFRSVLNTATEWISGQTVNSEELIYFTFPFILYYFPVISYFNPLA